MNRMLGKLDATRKDQGLLDVQRTMRGWLSLGLDLRTKISVAGMIAQVGGWILEHQDEMRWLSIAAGSGAAPSLCAMDGALLHQRLEPRRGGHSKWHLCAWWISGKDAVPPNLLLLWLLRKTLQRSGVPITLKPLKELSSMADSLRIMHIM